MHALSSGFFFENPEKYTKTLENKKRTVSYITQICSSHKKDEKRDVAIVLFQMPQSEPE